MRVSNSKSSNTCVYFLVAALVTSITSAKPIEGLERCAVTCLTVGSTATAAWTNSAGKTCRWSGIVGGNFGINSVNGGEYVLLSALLYTSKMKTAKRHYADPEYSYSCNGRCGAGCKGSAIGNAYTQDCFSHDICSWFNNASGGARYNSPI